MLRTFQDVQDSLLFSRALSYMPAMQQGGCCEHRWDCLLICIMQLSCQTCLIGQLSSVCPRAADPVLMAALAVIIEFNLMFSAERIILKCASRLSLCLRCLSPAFHVFYGPLRPSPHCVQLPLPRHSLRWRP